MSGEQGLGLGDGTGVFQDLAGLDALSSSSRSRTAARGWTTSTSTCWRASWASRPLVDARTLQRLEQALRDTGYLKRDSSGQYRLSPKAMRQLGKALLRDVARRMSGPPGSAGAAARRRGGDLSGPRGGGPSATPSPGTSPHDAQRRAAESRSPSRRLVPRLLRNRPGPLVSVDDIEVQGDRARTQAAVALLVDTSFSMAMDGRWVPMKRTARSPCTR